VINITKNKIRLPGVLAVILVLTAIIGALHTGLLHFNIIILMALLAPTCWLLLARNELRQLGQKEMLLILLVIVLQGLSLRLDAEVWVLFMTTEIALFGLFCLSIVLSLSRKLLPVLRILQQEARSQTREDSTPRQRIGGD
jgi:hypothetical protein